MAPFCKLIHPTTLVDFVYQKVNAILFLCFGWHIRFGFHWPPFCSIQHLHLHAISPADGIRTFYWLTGMFSPSMPWFRSVSGICEYLCIVCL